MKEAQSPTGRFISYLTAKLALSTQPIFRFARSASECLLAQLIGQLLSIIPRIILNRWFKLPIAFSQFTSLTPASVTTSAAPTVQISGPGYNLSVNDLSANGLRAANRQPAFQHVVIWLSCISARSLRRLYSLCSCPCVPRSGHCDRRLYGCPRS